MGSNAESLPIDRPASGLSPRWKWVISLLVAFHVAAVFVGPWAMPPNSSALGRSVANLISPYLQAASLDQGYRFFAPEPGPGHLIRYEVVAGDGRQIEGSFPDRAAQWPRLLYHRYFMMSEFLNGLGAPDRAELASAYQESYAGHLAYKYNAKSVKLFLRQHRLPTMDDIRAGKKLSDPEFYDERLVVEWTPD
ncbi:MAG TPA: hypothetical protein VMF30_11085 [Pirellulales bacterium]|nr:hypothetical protein [Pirellulales bacterium]